MKFRHTFHKNKTQMTEFLIRSIQKYFLAEIFGSSKINLAKNSGLSTFSSISVDDICLTESSYKEK